MKTIGWIVMQEVRLALCVLAVVGMGGCSARRPQPVATAPAPVAEPRRQPPPSSAYTVQPGDTLGRISACSGLSMSEITQLNGIQDPDLLLAGERLQLPRTHRCAAARRPRKEAANAECTRSLAAATKRYEAADFEKALSLAGACTWQRAPCVLDSGADTIRARCHVLAGMAAAGLEEPGRAIAEFRRAFAIDPGLDLSPQISPRIRELVDVARGEREASR